MKTWNGIFPALVTPFRSDGSINENSLRLLIRRLSKQGVAGFYVGGSTAECFLLTAKERLRLLEIAAEEVGNSLLLIFHTGSISTSEACSLARAAASIGADAVSSIPPFYYPFTKEELTAHYEAIMDSAVLPMILYNFPAFSGVTLKDEDIQHIAARGNVAGVKFTSGDFFSMERLHTSNPSLIIYNGYDEMLLAGLSMGASGGIGSTYNIMAWKFTELYRLFTQNKIEQARELQSEVNGIIKALSSNGLFQTLKYILTLTGIDSGSCRQPFLPLKPHQAAEAKRICALLYPEAQPSIPSSPKMR